MIYQTTGEYIELMQMLEDGSADEETIKDTMEAVLGNLELDYEEVGKIITNLNAAGNAKIAESKRLADAGQKLINRANNLKEKIMESMIACNMKKTTTPLFTFTVAGNGGKKPLIIPNKDEIPEEFMVTPMPVPDNEAIRKYLENNTCEWGYLGERGKHLLMN